MSIRENAFCNPFKNWPFPTSPVKSGLHPACSCPVDIDGTPLSPDGHECAAGFLHGYPIGIDTAPPRQIPAVKISRPGDEPKPAGRQTAIDSLRANSLRLKRDSINMKQKVDGKEQSVKGSLSNKSVGSSTITVVKATNFKENESNGRSVSQPTSSEANNARPHPRAPMSVVGNRSVSMSTNNSSGVTSSSWKNSSMASDSQTTLSSNAPGNESKGKAVWTYNSPESVPNVPGNSFGTKAPMTGPGAITPAKDPQPRSARGVYNTAGLGKMVLGCSQCLFDPRLRVTPCGCLICIECGGRFWSSICNDSEVFCGCGERVLSMVNLDPPVTNYQALPAQTSAVTVAPGLYTPTTVYSPQSVGASPSSSTGAVQFSSPTPTSRYHPSPVKIEKSPPAPRPSISAAQIPGTTAVPVSAPLNMNRMLMMDAETAMKFAPFVDLGRNSLAQNWSCVKIGNIPYNVTSDELLEFLGRNSNIVPEMAGSIGIHVIMDRSTGKTMDAYVEFMNAKDAWKCVSRRRSRVLGNRHLSLDVVDPSELMKDIFPRAKGISWDGVIPTPSANKSEFGSKTEIISREELVLIVNHARTPHRSPFSRKCLQRPFQSLMSIVSKFPWFAVNLYTIQQRDYIFQALLSAIDILKRQIKRGRTMPNLDLELLKALLRVGIRCSGFTDAQKYELVKTAEFGAEGIRVDADIGVLSGFEALGKAIGAERKVLEFYTLLLELSISPILNETSPQSQAAVELIRGKGISKQPTDESKKSHLTMAEASTLEWNTIEKAVRSVLPSKRQHHHHHGYHHGHHKAAYMANLAAPREKLTKAAQTQTQTQA